MLPQPLTLASGRTPAPSSSPTTGGTGSGLRAFPASHGPWPKAEQPADREDENREKTGARRRGASEGSDSDADNAPPLHDTRAHLRAVHALLDSLPAEFRSTQRRSPLGASALGEKKGLGLPWPSAEPPTDRRSVPVLPLGLDTYAGVAEGGGAAEGGGGGDEDPPGLPELRRMLSSLDRMDRRLFALAPGSAVPGGVDGAQDGGREDGEVKDGPVVNGVAATTDGPCSDVNAADETDSVESNSFGVDPAAVSTLQRAWRARSRRLREAAAVEARLEACARRQRCRDEAAIKIQAAHRRARARHEARTTAEDQRRWEGRQRRRAAACAMLERAWKAFEVRRRAARELAEACARADAAMAAERRARDRFRAAALLQAVWRGALVRAAAGRLEVSRARSRMGDRHGHSRIEEDAGGVPTLVQVGVDAEQTAPPPAAVRVSGVALYPPRTPLLPAAPSTFYNQLSQDPRRGHRLPDSHVAVVAAALPSSMSPPRSVRPEPRGVEEVKGGYAGAQSERFGPRPVTRGAGVMRPPRFSDLETARIARIMKGSLQQWAGGRSGGGGSSSSDDYDV